LTQHDKWRTLLGTLRVVAALAADLAAGCVGPDRKPVPEPRSATIQRAADLPQRAPDTVAVSVGAAQPPADTTPPHPPDTLPSGYSLTDTTIWGNPVEDGERAILRRGNIAIDTVALEFPVVSVGKDSLIYLAVRNHDEPSFTKPDSSPGYESFPTEFFLWTPSSHRELREFLPFFRSNNSSPFVENESVIYYWGVAPPGPQYRTYAMRYDFRTARLDSAFIGPDDLASDYRYYLRVPRISETEVNFQGHRLDKATWQVIPPDSAVR
jgi:hypothetical protein